MIAAVTHSFQVEQVRNIAVICFTIDTINEQNFDSVAAELDAFISSQRSRRVVVDLASVRHIDDLGLAVLQSFNAGIEEI